MESLENGQLESNPPLSMATTAGSGSNLLSQVAEIVSHGFPSNALELSNACISKGILGVLGCELSGIIPDSTQESLITSTSSLLKEQFVTPSPPLSTNFPSFDPFPPFVPSAPPPNPPPPPPPPPPSVPTTFSATATDSTIFSVTSSIPDIPPTSTTFDPGTSEASSVTDSRDTRFGIATSSSDSFTSSSSVVSETPTSISDTSSSIIAVPSEFQSSVPLSTITTFTPASLTSTTYTSSPDATTHSSNDNAATHASQFNDVKVPVLIGGIVGFFGVALIVAILFFWIVRRRRRVARNRLSAASSFFGREHRWSTFSSSDQSSDRNMNTISHFYNTHDNSNNPSIPRGHTIV